MLVGCNIYFLAWVHQCQGVHLDQNTMSARQKKLLQEPKYSFPSRLRDYCISVSKLFYKPTPVSHIPKQVVLIEHFFPDELCDELIKSFQQNLTLETTPLRKSKYYSPRVNDRVSLNDFDTADTLWQYFKYIVLNPLDLADPELEEVKEEFSTAKSLNPQLRIYRYVKGHFFGKHYDDSVTCPIASNPSQSGQTKWTVLIYLTGDESLKGGATIFHPDTHGAQPMKVQPRKGTALLHKHGPDCLKHEGELVEAGEKWILRTDVTF